MLAERFLHSFALGDLPAQTAVADEAPRLVEHRQPRNGPVPLAAVGLRARKLEIAEWQMGVERLPMLAPGLFVGLQVG